MKKLAVLLVIVAFGILSLQPTSLYVSERLNRGASYTFAEDSNAGIGIVESNNPGRGNKKLFDLTNQFNDNADFTISLENRTSEYDLSVNNQNGDTVTVSLSSGQSVGVKLKRQGRGSNSGYIKYSITVEQSNFQGSLTRVQKISSTGPCESPPYPPPCD